MADPKIDPQELKEIGKGFSDSIKESINSLKAMAKSYDTVISKIDAMNKQTINTKKIQKELEAAEAKRATAQRKFNEIEAAADVQQKARADAYTDALQQVEAQIEKVKRASMTGNSVQIQQEQNILNALDAQLDYAKASLQAQDINLIAHREALNIAEKTTEEVEGRLQAEKQLASELSLTGKAIGYISKTTGLLKDTYGKIVEQARDGGKTTDTWLIGTAIGIAAVKKGWDLLKFAVTTGIDLFKKGLSALAPEGAKNPLSGLVGTFSNILKQVPLIGGFLGGLVDVLNDALTILLSVNDTIVKAGRSLNLNTQEATALYRQYQQISRVNNDIFVTTEKLLQSRVELSDLIGVNNALSEETLATNIKLKDIAGIEAQTRANIAQNAIIAGKTSEGLVKSVFAQVTGLQKATGISLNYQKVLKEANSLGGYLGLAFAKYPEKLTKSLVTTQALGLSLKELDGIANSFLDFESSIGSEFEAQLLTGKEINLQTARRLFLQNDLAGAALEINKQVGSSEEFLNMNRIAAESLAKAFGMSRDALGEMLKKQELMAKIGAKETDNSREQLRIALEKYKTQENLVAAIGEEAYQNMVNASTQEKIGAFLDKVKTTFIDFIENSGIIQKVESFMKYLSSPENIQKMISSVKNIVARAVEVIGNLTYYTLNALDWMTFGAAIDESFLDSIKSGTAEAVNSIRNADIGTPVTVSNNMIGSARREASSVATVAKPTIINNHTTSVVEVRSNDGVIAAGVIKNFQQPVVGENSGNKTMVDQNGGISR